MKTRKLLTIFCLGVILLFAAFHSDAQDTIVKHPAYLQALSELREARWMIGNPPGDSKSTEELTAIIKIDEVINEIKGASIDDGKDRNDQPKVEEHSVRLGRLDAAIEFLRKAQEEVKSETDIDFAQQLRGKVLKNINDAIDLTTQALQKKTIF